MYKIKNSNKSVSIAELNSKINDIWKSCTPEYFQNLVNTILRRINDVICFRYTLVSNNQM